jgi:hypothetical protein
MNDLKQPYIAPDAVLCRVFLEKGIAAKTSLILSGVGSIQQTDWTDVSDEIAGASDTQGDIWFVY